MIRVFDMFAGYGGAEFALKKEGIEHECVGFSEINKYAIKVFEQNFPNVKNYGDCTKINPTDLPDFDLLTGGFPCQDVSIAGQRDLSKGRTNLYLEVLRIANLKKPKYMLLENVKGLASMEVEERKLINKIVADLQKIGYGVCWKILNSSDFGIPQNRERIWFVCKLGGWNFAEFNFPTKEELKIFLIDLLDDQADEKYYLSEEQMKRLLVGIKNKNRSKIGVLQESISGALTARDYKTLKCIRIDKQEGRDREYKRVYSANGLSPTLHGKTGGWQEVKVAIPVLTPNRAEKRQNGRRFKDNGESMFTLTGQDIHGVYDGQIIRRLTPKEYFRLMGFVNDEINLEGISDTKAYSLAGNGWDINIVSKIFKQMFKVPQVQYVVGKQDEEVKQ